MIGNLKANFFSSDYISTDVEKGVILSKGGTRLISLTEDFLKGFRNALIDETGPANRLVFYNCGKNWGLNMARRFEKEISNYYGTELKDLSMAFFDSQLKEFWLRYGWGEIDINWHQASETGIFDIKIKNPAFSSVFAETENFSDDIFAGILGSFFSYFSNQDLICFQTGFDSNQSEGTSLFVLGIKPRLKDVEDMISSKISHNEIMQKLIKT